MDHSAAIARQPGDKHEARYSALKAERDRFVALAFCSADLLFELDTNGQVVFACGASALLLGRQPEALNGCSFIDLVAPVDQAVTTHLLRRARGGDRFDNVRVRLQGVADPTPPLVVNGFGLPDLGGHVYLAMRVDAAPAQTSQEPQKRDEASGMLERDSFANAASQAISAAEARGESLELTLIELADFEALKGRLQEEARRELMGTVGASLRASSVHGDMAGRLDDEHFGLLHRLGTDIDAITQEISESARKLDPDGVGTTVSNTTVAVDTKKVPGADPVKVLRYTFNKYCEQSADGFSLTSLSESLNALTHEAINRMSQFGSIVARGQFRIAFQPICDLSSLRPHHFEALVRFGSTSVGASPYEVITFAEEVGMICKFDLAMVQKVVEAVSKFGAAGHQYNIAVNLSSRSLGTPSFVEELGKLLQRNAKVRSQIIFEITESAKISDLENINMVIQSLRRDGHVVCLDDLGAGEAAFHYLSALDVDVVKIDGAYIKEAMHSLKGKALLRAMATVCRELNVVAIGEFIEDKHHAMVARDCGIQFGQGYFLGRPSETISDFDSPRPAAFN